MREGATKRDKLTPPALVFVNKPHPTLVLEDHPELELLSQALSFQSPAIKVTTRIEALSCKPVSKEKKLFKALEHDLNSDMELSASISPPEHGNTPPAAAAMNSVFGPLDKKHNRKTFWLLISTLNLAFPDFDFSNVPADDFAREPSASAVLSSLSSALNHLRTTSNAGPNNSVYRSFSSYAPVAPSHMSQQPPLDTSGGGGHSYSSRSPEPAAALSPPPLKTASKVASDPATADGEAPTHPYLREILDPIIDLDHCEVYSYAPEIESDPHAVESEMGSAAASDVGDADMGADGSFTPLDDGTMWDMEGVPSNAGSAPVSPLVPAALNEQTRTHRSGHAYFTNSPMRRMSRGRRKANFAAGLRDRSLTPSGGDGDEDEDSTGGLLWSSVVFHFSLSFPTSWSHAD